MIASGARAATAGYIRRLYILNRHGNESILLLNAETAEKLAEIPALGASCMASPPNSNLLYVAREPQTTGGASLISVIDKQQAAIVDSFTLDGMIPGLGEKEIAAAPDGKYLYVAGRQADGTAAVFVIDLASKQIIKTLVPFENAFSNSIALSPDGQQLLVYTLAGIELADYDTLTWTKTTIPQFYGFDFVRFHPNGSRFYTVLGANLQAWDSATLQPIDAETFQLSDTAPEFDDMTIDTNGFLGYINVPKTGEIYVVDLVKNEVADVIETGDVGVTRVMVPD